MNGLIDTKELMKYLKVSYSTIFRWRKAGMPYRNVGYNMCRYDLAEVNSWLSKQEIGK